MNKLVLHFWPSENLFINIYKIKKLMSKCLSYKRKLFNHTLYIEGQFKNLANNILIINGFFAFKLQ